MPAAKAKNTGDEMGEAALATGGAASAVPTTLFASAGIIGVNASGSTVEEMNDDVELRRAGDDSYATKQQTKAATGPDGIDQFELAKTQVTKVAKSAISEEVNVQLRKEVLLGLIKSSTVFINYLAAAALDKTVEAGNKTMSAQHVLAAFKEMDFPEHYYVQLKKEYSEKQRAEAEKTTTTAKSKDASADDDVPDATPTMDVDEDASSHAVAGVGEESLAVGEETLAAVDKEMHLDEEEDDGEEAEEGG